MAKSIRKKLKELTKGFNVILIIVLLLFGFGVGYLTGEAHAFSNCVHYGQKLLNIEIKPEILFELKNRLGGIDVYTPTTKVLPNTHF